MRFVLLLILLAIASQSFLLITAHPAGWDEAVYIGMGKFLYSAGQSGLWEPLRPVLLPAVLGIPWVLNLPVIPIGEIIGITAMVGTALLIYGTARNYMESAGAFLCSAIFITAPVVVLQSSQLMSGMPAAFFGMLAVYWHHKPAHSGIAAALSFLTRYPLGLVGAALFFLSLKKPIRTITFTIGAAIVGVPFLLANTIAYRSHGLAAPIYPLVQALPHQSNPVHAAGSLMSSLIFYPLNIFLQAPIFLFALPGIYLFAKKKQWHILLPFLLLVLYFTFITNKQMRFAIVFLPFLALFAGYAVWKFFKSFHFPQSIALLSLLLIISLSLFTSASFTAERVSWLPTEVEVPALSLKEGATVLTIDPRFAVDFNNRFIPFYDNPFTGEQAYRRHISEADIVIYSEDFFPCSTPECSVQLDILNKEVRSLPAITTTKVYNADFQFYLPSERVNART